VKNLVFGIEVSGVFDDRGNPRGLTFAFEADSEPPLTEYIVLKLMDWLQDQRKIAEARRKGTDNHNAKQAANAAKRANRIIEQG